MDGLRKVPDNVPNKDMLARHLGKPLTRIPDPFGTHDSFGAHNNARLRAFLDSFGFEYEFASSTDYYASGRFDAALLRVLECYDEVMAVILPTLGAGPAGDLFADPADPPEDRHRHAGADGAAATPPPAPSSGATPTPARRFETSVKGGACKLQWKADWAMRWYALGVDYEMSGKDLIDSVQPVRAASAASSAAQPPESFTYELFLDEHAQKISKSQGQRPVGRGMAALRPAGIAWRSSCTTSRSAPSGCIST